MSESPKGMSRFELEEALRQQGCAVCRLVERAGSSDLEYLLYDLVNDPDVQKEFRASLGLCERHAQRMLEAERPGSERRACATRFCPGRNAPCPKRVRRTSEMSRMSATTGSLRQTAEDYVPQRRSGYSFE